MASLWWKMVRFGFRLLYNELAWTYDLVSWVVSAGRWRKWQQAALRHIAERENDILELAHGTANLQLDIINAGMRSIAIDVSNAMGRIASQKLKRQRIAPRLVRASAMRLPFPTASFSAIVSTFPTEFIFDPQTISEIRRLLVVTGRLIVVLNGMLTMTNLGVRFLEWLYVVTGQRGVLPDDPFRAFKDAGFDTRLHVDNLGDSIVWVLVATPALTSETQVD